MSAEWIDTAELLRRSGLKPRTLERLIADQQITCRQRKRGAKRDFNWRVVERELALLDSTHGRSPLARSAAASGAASPQLVQLLAEAEGFVDRLRALVGRAA